MCLGWVRNNNRNKFIKLLPPTSHETKQRAENIVMDSIRMNDCFFRPAHNRDNWIKQNWKAQPTNSYAWLIAIYNFDLKHIGKTFSLPQKFQSGSAAHPASSPMYIGPLLLLLKKGHEPDHTPASSGKVKNESTVLFMPRSISHRSVKRNDHPGFKQNVLYTHSLQHFPLEYIAPMDSETRKK
jgi:hypothetical protein